MSNLDSSSGDDVIVTGETPAPAPRPPKRALDTGGNEVTVVCKVLRPEVRAALAEAGAQPRPPDVIADTQQPSTSDSAEVEPTVTETAATGASDSGATATGASDAGATASLPPQVQRATRSELEERQVFENDFFRALRYARSPPRIKRMHPPPQLDPEWDAPLNNLVQRLVGEIPAALEAAYHLNKQHSFPDQQGPYRLSGLRIPLEYSVMLLARDATRNAPSAVYAQLLIGDDRQLRCYLTRFRHNEFEIKGKADVGYTMHSELLELDSFPPPIEYRGHSVALACRHGHLRFDPHAQCPVCYLSYLLRFPAGLRPTPCHESGSCSRCRAMTPAQRKLRIDKFNAAKAVLAGGRKTRVKSGSRETCSNQLVANAYRLFGLFVVMKEFQVQKPFTVLQGLIAGEKLSKMHNAGAHTTQNIQSLLTKAEKKALEGDLHALVPLQTDADIPTGVKAERLTPVIADICRVICGTKPAATVTAEAEKRREDRHRSRERLQYLEGMLSAAQYRMPDVFESDAPEDAELVEAVRQTRADEQAIVDTVKDEIRQLQSDIYDAEEAARELGEPVTDDEASCPGTPTIGVEDARVTAAPLKTEDASPSRMVAASSTAATSPSLEVDDATLLAAADAHAAETGDASAGETPAEEHELSTLEPRRATPLTVDTSFSSATTDAPRLGVTCDRDSGIITVRARPFQYIAETHNLAFDTQGLPVFMVPRDESGTLLVGTTIRFVASGTRRVAGQSVAAVSPPTASVSRAEPQ